MKIEHKTTQHIAQLSRLKLSESEIQEHSEQLTKIIGYFNKISTLPTDGVEPLLTPTQIENYWREDISENNFKTEDLIENAPSKQGALFKVPPVV